MDIAVIHQPAGIKGAPSKELPVNSVLGENVASKRVWIPLEDCLRHLSNKIGLQKL